MVADNGRFWALVTGQPAGDGLAGRAFLASVFVFGIGLVSLVLTLLTYGRAARYVLAALLVVSAAAAWFMNRYGILLDQGMIENLFATDRAEALELVGVGLAGHVVLYGLLPAAVVWRMLPRRQSLWDLVLEKSALAAASLLIMAVAVGPFFKDYASMVRNHREIRYLLTPVNYLGSLYSWAADLSARPEGVEPVGEDASRGAHWATVHRRGRAGRRRDGPRRQLLAERLWPSHQPAPGQTGSGLFRECQRVRHGHGRLAALHVLRPAARELQQSRGARPRGPARRG
jgi:lipid A ethanolaminephosphotransferase